MHPLLPLIRQRDEAGLIQRIAQQPDLLDQPDERGFTGFLLIAYNGLEQALQYASQQKKTLSFQEAIIAGQTKVVADRVAEQADLVHEKAADGFTPVALAAYFMRGDLVKWLLEHGADPDEPAANPAKVNALHAAVAREQTEIVQLLLEHGVEVNAPQMQAVTALHTAAQRGNAELVERLLKNGADRSLKTSDGSTAMDFAKQGGHQSVIALLQG